MNRNADVLVVDDDPDLIELVRTMLCCAGYEVRSARNGMEALEAAAQRTPAIVLLDVMMPGMDGWECARELRSRYGPSMRIVIVTATAHARARADQVGGVDDVLSKPFDMDELLGVVARFRDPRTPTLQSAEP
jgi:CheY-like chemotaxis protein